MVRQRLVRKTMGYTKAALRAAEDWMAESGTGESVDRRDLEAVTEHLAEAFTDFARQVSQQASNGGEEKPK